MNILLGIVAVMVLLGLFAWVIVEAIKHPAEVGEQI